LIPQSAARRNGATGPQGPAAQVGGTWNRTHSPGIGMVQPELEGR
jgi:hypothetical protein